MFGPKEEGRSMRGAGQERVNPVIRSIVWGDDASNSARVASMKENMPVTITGPSGDFRWKAVEASTNPDQLDALSLQEGLFRTYTNEEMDRNVEFFSQRVRAMRHLLGQKSREFFRTRDEGECDGPAWDRITKACTLAGYSLGIVGNDEEVYLKKFLLSSNAIALLRNIDSTIRELDLSESEVEELGEREIGPFLTPKVAKAAAYLFTAKSLWGEECLGYARAIRYAASPRMSSRS